MISEEKKIELRTLLKQVNVSTICKEQGLRAASVWEALSGKKRDTETLEKVVKIARSQLARRARKLKCL